MEGLDLKQMSSMVKVIAEEKGLPEESVLNIIETAIAAAWRKENGDKDMNVRAVLNLDNGEAEVFVAHKVVNHIREFKWVDFFAFCSELLLEFFQLVVHRHNANEVVSTHIVHVFPTIPSDGECRTLPSWTTHLVDIPVGGEVRQVADTRIGAVAFYILVVPKREGVVVAIGEDNRISLFVERVEIVQTKVASGSAS